MLHVVLISVLCFNVAMSMTTMSATTKGHHHHSHPPHSPKPSMEPAEHENFKFVYEPHAQKMLVITAKTCYVFSISDAERSAIHTDAGIRAVELKLLSTLSTAAVTEVTKDQLDAKTAHACGKVMHYFTETVV